MVVPLFVPELDRIQSTIRSSNLLWKGRAICVCGSPRFNYSLYYPTVVDITSVSLETERLLEEGGLDTVKTVYFPRFGETDIFVFPEVQSRNHMPEAWPEGGSHALLQEQDTGSLVVSAEPLPSDVQFRSQPTRACEKHLMRSTTSRQLTTSESTTQSLQHSLENGMNNSF